MEGDKPLNTKMIAVTDHRPLPAPRVPGVVQALAIDGDGKVSNGTVCLCWNVAALNLPEITKWMEARKAELDKAVGCEFVRLTGGRQPSDSKDIAVLVMFPPGHSKEAGWAFPAKCHRLTDNLSRYVLWGTAEELSKSFVLPVLKPAPEMALVETALLDDFNRDATLRQEVARLAARDPVLEAEIWKKARPSSLPDEDISCNRATAFSSSGSPEQVRLEGHTPIVTRDGRFGLFYEHEGHQIVAIAGRECEHLFFRSSAIHKTPGWNLYVLADRISKETPLSELRSLPQSAWKDFPSGHLSFLSSTSSGGAPFQRLGHIFDLGEKFIQHLIRRLPKHQDEFLPFFDEPRAAVNNEIAFVLRTSSEFGQFRRGRNLDSFKIIRIDINAEATLLLCKGPKKAVCDSLYFIELPEKERSDAIQSTCRQLVDLLESFSLKDFESMTVEDWLNVLVKLAPIDITDKLRTHLVSVVKELKLKANPTILNYIRLCAPYILDEPTKEQNLVDQVKRAIDRLSLEKAMQAEIAPSPPLPAPSSERKHRVTDTDSSIFEFESVGSHDERGKKVEHALSLSLEAPSSVGSGRKARPHQAPQEVFDHWYSPPWPVSSREAAQQKLERHRAAEAARAEDQARQAGSKPDRKKNILSRSGTAAQLQSSSSSSSSSSTHLGSRVAPFKHGVIDQPTTQLKRLRDLVQLLHGMNFAHGNTRGSHVKFVREGETPIVITAGSRRMGNKAPKHQIQRFLKKFEKR
jgi:hypothetical protein